MFFHGDLNKLYLEPEDSLDQEIIDENQNQHEKFKKFVEEQDQLNKYQACDDEYYDDEDY